MLTLIASLPPALAFCGLIVYLLTSQRRPPSPILLEILAIIKAKSGKVPSLDKRLSGKEVARLLDRHPEFKQYLSHPILELLHEVRKSEERESIRVMVVLAGSVLLSLLIFALTLLPQKHPRPIDALYYKYDLTQPLNASNQTCFEIAAQLIGPYFDGNDTEQLAVDKLRKSGVLAQPKIGEKASNAMKNYKFDFVRGTVLWNAFVDAVTAAGHGGQPCTADTMIMSLTLTNDSKATPQSVLDGRSKVFWKFNITNSPEESPPGMQLQFDFGTMTLHTWTPSQIQAATPGDGLKYWDDFADKTLLVMPLASSGNMLNALDIYSKLGKEFPLPGYVVRQLSNNINATTGQDYFVIGPAP